MEYCQNKESLLAGRIMRKLTHSHRSLRKSHLLPHLKFRTMFQRTPHLLEMFLSTSLMTLSRPLTRLSRHTSTKVLLPQRKLKLSKLHLHSTARQSSPHAAHASQERAQHAVHSSQRRELHAAHSLQERVQHAAHSSQAAVHPATENLKDLSTSTLFRPQTSRAS